MIKQNQKLRRTLLDAQVQRCPSSAVMLSVMCLCDCVRVWRGSGGVSACCVQEIALLVLISTHFICNHLSLKCTQIIVYNIFLGLANRNFAVCMAGRKRSCCSGGIWFPSGLLFVLILHSLLVAGINEMKIRSDSAQFLCTQHTPCHAHTHTHTHTQHTHTLSCTHTHTHTYTQHTHTTHTHTHTHTHYQQIHYAHFLIMKFRMFCRIDAGWWQRNWCVPKTQNMFGHSQSLILRISWDLFLLYVCALYVHGVHICVHIYWCMSVCMHSYMKMCIYRTPQTWLLVWGLFLV